MSSTVNEPLATTPQPGAHTEESPQADPTGWRGALPMVAVTAALVGLAAWGHHTDWTFLPTAISSEIKNQKSDWCGAHGVPESLCVECNPALAPRPPGFGWCQEHEVPECPLCHPELAQLPAKPTVTAAQRELALRALRLTDRPKNDPLCKLHQRRLQFASEEAAARAGIDVAPVVEGSIVESVPANGEIGYDLTRVARLSARVPGFAWLVVGQVGDRVQQGSVLALIDAPEVGRVKGEFLQAFAQVNLKRKAWESLSKLPGVAAERTVQEAAAALREARIRLLSTGQALINLGVPLEVDAMSNLSEDKLSERVRFLGLPEAFLRTLDSKTATATLLPVKSPMDGIIVAREVVAGETVEAGKALFVVADTRRMWLNLDVRIEDARLLAVGQPVVFLADGQRQDIAGKIAWISTSVEEKTRTVKVRAELDNLAGKLRAGTFGAGRIVLREEKNAVLIPKDGLHWDGGCHVVFVRDKDYFKQGSPKIFHVRKVVPGPTDAGNVEIIAGLLPGEVVAAKGSSLLRDELLKNNLKAECAHAK